MATSDSLPAEVEARLDAIEREVRAARGEQVEKTPWDFQIPTTSDLKELRTTAGLSVEDVADATGYAESTVRNYESGKPPGREYITTLLRLCKMEWPRDEEGL